MQAALVFGRGLQTWLRAGTPGQRRSSLPPGSVTQHLDLSICHLSRQRRVPQGSWKGQRESFPNRETLDSSVLPPHFGDLVCINAAATVAALGAPRSYLGPV